MEKTLNIAQIYVRLALGISFLLPVLDRLGFTGAPGTAGVAWGNWDNFVNYTNTLMPYLSKPLSNIWGIAATIFEFAFGIMLIAGYKTKLAAYGSFLLLLIFALSMLFFAGLRAPFSYSVFTGSAAALLLSALPDYKWSVNNILNDKS